MGMSSHQQVISALFRALLQLLHGFVWRIIQFWLFWRRQIEKAVVKRLCPSLMLHRLLLWGVWGEGSSTRLEFFRAEWLIRWGWEYHVVIRCLGFQGCTVTLTNISVKLAIILILLARGEFVLYNDVGKDAVLELRLVLFLHVFFVCYKFTHITLRVESCFRSTQQCEGLLIWHLLVLILTEVCVLLFFRTFWLIWVLIFLYLSAARRWFNFEYEEIIESPSHSEVE